MKKLGFLGIIGIVALFSISNLFAIKDTPRVKNSTLIKFSHKLHINDVGASCTDCHGKAASSTSEVDYLIPDMQTCFTCHDQSTTSCDFCHTSSDTTTYRKLAQTSSPVYFSHKEHFSSLNLKCETCHQDLNKFDYAYQDAKAFPNMSLCTTCHGQLQGNAPRDTVVHASQLKIAPGGCETCHKDLSNLVPVSHKSADFITQHKNFVNVGGAQNDCKSCHTPASCQECHDAANLAKDLSPTQIYVPSTPELSPVPSHKKLTVQRVHSLNYRFTHSIDAKGRESNCYTCHDERTFCVKCHESNGERIKPVWHDGGDFVTFGVGSGGGRHAVYARKDIESCASCHDVQGADPTCVTCHNDPDGIKGNDPKTHPAFYMHDVEGNWHTDAGAVCYTCHTDPNAHPGGTPGVGFCGYCHGRK